MYRMSKEKFFSTTGAWAYGGSYEGNGAIDSLVMQL